MDKLIAAKSEYIIPTRWSMVNVKHLAEFCVLSFKKVEILRSRYFEQWGYSTDMEFYEDVPQGRSVLTFFNFSLLPM